MSPNMSNGLIFEQWELTRLVSSDTHKYERLTLWDGTESSYLWDEQAKAKFGLEDAVAKRTEKTYRFEIKN